MSPPRRRPAVNVTLPRGLRAAYEDAAAAHELPSLGALLEQRVTEVLEELGWPIPEAEPRATRTAAATAARLAAQRARRENDRR